MEFVLDASVTLRWCFEDQATPGADSVLSRLQDQTDSAMVPGIWLYELLNGLGKGVTRDRLEREKAFSLWHEIQGLPIRMIEVPANETLLELALHYNLAVYDASYLSLAISRGLTLVTSDEKLATAAQNAGILVLRH